MLFQRAQGSLLTLRIHAEISREANFSLMNSSLEDLAKIGC